MRFSRIRDIAPVRDGAEQQNSLVIVWIVVIATFVAVLGGEPLLGYEISGFGWFIPFGYALYVLFAIPGMPSFPYWISMPWIALVVGYVIFADAAHALQRSVMLIAPIVVGIAVSKSAIRRSDLLRIESILDKFSVAFFGVILLHSGLALTGVLPEVTGLAPESTTASLFAAFFAAKYALGGRLAVVKWILFAAVPVIAVTRTAVVAAGLTLPLTFAPFPRWKRIVTLIVIAALGLLVFHSERIQKKMFYSGEGTIFDVTWDNPDLRTSGRLGIEELMTEAIKDLPWFGHGSNASEELISDIFGGLTHPHNDWLRLTYEYGYVGMLIFLGTLMFQTAHAVRAGYRSVGVERLFLLAGAGAFIPFAVFMRTDNIILYAAFFGNMHYMILGAGYAAAANEEGALRSAESGFQEATSHQ